MTRLAARIAAQGGALLVIDYGYDTPGRGETLQAVKRHCFADPLRDPGEADLTAHVDFCGLSRAARAAGAKVHGPVPQGEWLARLGIHERAAKLRRYAGLRQRAAIDSAAPASRGRKPRLRRNGHGEALQGARGDPAGPLPARLRDRIAMMQQTATPLRASILDAPGLTHGFFTRQGGVSTGVYASLNGGVGSQDDPRSVAENRRRMAAHLCVDPAHLLVPYQIHSPKALIVTQAFVERPRCDALVTSVRGLGIGVTGADCGMILFADRGARVIAAAHAGWKGALDGVLEATLDAMETLGARRASTVAALGPMIARNSYEVDTEFADRFIAASTGHASFFSASARDGHFMFDLPGLSRCGCGLRASAYSRIWPATPMPNPKTSIPTAVACIETSPITAANRGDRACLNKSRFPSCSAHRSRRSGSCHQLETPIPFSRILAKALISMVGAHGLEPPYSRSKLSFEPSVVRRRDCARCSGRYERGAPACPPPRDATTAPSWSLGLRRSQLRFSVPRMYPFLHILMCDRAFLFDRCERCLMPATCHSFVSRYSVIASAVRNDRLRPVLSASLASRFLILASTRTGKCF